MKNKFKDNNSWQFQNKNNILVNFDLNISDVNIYNVLMFIMLFLLQIVVVIKSNVLLQLKIV